MRHLQNIPIFVSVFDIIATSEAGEDFNRLTAEMDDLVIRLDAVVSEIPTRLPQDGIMPIHYYLFYMYVKCLRNSYTLFLRILTDRAGCGTFRSW